MSTTEEPEPKEEEEAPPARNRFVTELVVFKNGLTMGGGDLASWAQLFFDNLSTLLGALGAVQALVNDGVPQDQMDNTLFGKVVPAVGISFFLGNIYYSWQAIRVSNKWGRQYTAMPYGLNTPAAFAFVYNIIYAVFYDQLGKGATPSDAFETAYKVSLAGNFITGVISVCLGTLGSIILKVVPPAALLIPIAGIGIAFLGLEQLSKSFAAPLVGYPAVFWVYLGWYAGIKIGWGKYQIPEALTVILVGVILGWATGLNEPQEVERAAQLVKWWGISWEASFFQDFDMIGDYLGIIIPIGIAGTASSLMCLVSAKEAGDPLPVRESMIVDGIGTMLAACFGSPFGTVMYLGHPAYKRNGAKVGYSLLNGITYLILALFGILAVMQSIVNSACIGPIVFLVGLMINVDCIAFLPPRHYAAYIIGLFPAIYDWTVNISDRAPLIFSIDGYEGEYNVNMASGQFVGWMGVLAWKYGSLLTSMIWAALISVTIDRKWKLAGIWAMVGAFFAGIGLIHVPQAGFSTFTQPTPEQCDASRLEKGQEPCWQQGEQWMYMTAYIMLAAFCGLIYITKVLGLSDRIPDEIDDETAHAFDDWFRDAGKATPSATDEGEEDLKDHKVTPPGIAEMEEMEELGAEINSPVEEKSLVLEISA